MNFSSPDGTLRRVARVLQVSQLVALLLLIGASGLLWRNIEDFRRADLWVDHSHDVRSRIDLVRVTVQRGGLALRNFAISPRGEFLDSLAASSAEAHKASSSLVHLVSDNVDQAMRAHEAHSETTEILGWYRSSKVIAQRDGFEALHSTLKSRVNIDASGRLRQLLDEMDAEERILLEERRAGRDRRFTSIKQWTAAVVGLFFLFTMAAITHASRLVKIGERGVERLQTNAEKDPLTGLFNRRAIDRHAQQLDGKPYAVVTFDLDHFKPVNDRFGHAAGDAVLKAVAERLQHQSRGGDVPARMGGDEFLVLLPGLHDEEVVKAVAARIGAAVAQPIVFEGVRLNVGASMGYACTTGNVSLDRLVQQADTMAYAVKRRGRSTVV